MTQVFPNLEYLFLQETVHLTDDVLLLLSNFPKLKRIDISGDYLYTRFSSDVFFTIAQSAPQLETLVLNGPFPNMIDGTKLVQALLSMPHLKQVNFNTTHHDCYFNNNICMIAYLLKISRFSITVYINNSEAVPYLDLDDDPVL